MTLHNFLVLNHLLTLMIAKNLWPPIELHCLIFTQKVLMIVYMETEKTLMMKTKTLMMKTETLMMKMIQSCDLIIIYIYSGIIHILYLSEWITKNQYLLRYQVFLAEFSLNYPTFWLGLFLLLYGWYCVANVLLIVEEDHLGNKSSLLLRGDN